MVVLYLIVQHTKMGTAMRAVSEDAEAAALMGIDVNKVVVFTFMLGGVMAGIAGVFYAFVFKQVYFYMGFTPGIKAFGARGAGRHRQRARRDDRRVLPGALWNPWARRCSSTASAYRRRTSCAT